MILRPATADDAVDVWTWRNDPLTRAMSRNQDEIDRASHVAWFERALRDARRTLLIGEVDGEKVGMVRIDRAEETEVSINVNPAHRSRGHGYALLSQALALVSGDVVAEIREDNLASQRLFERLGFERQGSRDGFRRYRRRAG
jgi:ribosomal protein S18 acetylase RimI-like enzyme